MTPRIVFARSAEKHGYTLAEVLYAYINTTRMEEHQQGRDILYKFTGEHHGDPLVPTLEVVMKRTPGRVLVVFHVNAEQGTFWSTPVEEQYDE